MASHSTNCPVSLKIVNPSPHIQYLKKVREAKQEIRNSALLTQKAAAQVAWENTLKGALSCVALIAVVGLAYKFRASLFSSLDPHQTKQFVVTLANGAVTLVAVAGLGWNAYRCDQERRKQNEAAAAELPPQPEELPDYESSKVHASIVDMQSRFFPKAFILATNEAAVTYFRTELPALYTTSMENAMEIEYSAQSEETRSAPLSEQLQWKIDKMIDEISGHESFQGHEWLVGCLETPYRVPEANTEKSYKLSYLACSEGLVSTSAEAGVYYSNPEQSYAAPSHVSQGSSSYNLSPEHPFHYVALHDTAVIARHDSDDTT